METINKTIIWLHEKMRAIMNPAIFNICILIIGVFLRTYHYLLNRSLWLDEASLTLNILDRDWAGLLQPLVHDQGAPIGFLLLEKLIVSIFGQGEMALRLVPFLAGIASLFLFYFLLRKYLSPWAVSFGLGLFAFSEPLIYFASEVKQYGLDVLICLLIFWFGLDLLQKPEKASSWVMAGIAGMIGVWFSHPAAVILAGIGLAYGFSALKDRKWVEIAKITGLSALWLGSFAVLFFLSLRNLLGNDYLNIFWEDGFLPLTPSFSQIHWLVTRYFGLFGYSETGLAVPVIGAILLPVGLIHLGSGKKGKLSLAFISITIIAIALSALELYPFLGRMIVYLIPLIILMVAAGFEWFLSLEIKFKEMVLLILISVSFAQPLKVAAVNVKNKRSTQDFRPVLQFVQENIEEGDILLVNTSAQNNLEFYQRQLDFYPENLVVLDNEENFWGHYMNYIEWLDGEPRVWVLISHYYSNENRMFESALISHGEEITSLHLTNADAWLFDLSR